MVTKTKKKKVTKKVTKKKATKKKAPVSTRVEVKEGAYTFSPQRNPTGWVVSGKKGVIGTILSGKEISGRTCFRIDGDKSGRTYRGKLKAAHALERANTIVETTRKKKLSPVMSVLYAWEHREPASRQWNTPNGATKKTAKKKARRKVTKK